MITIPGGTRDRMVQLIAANQVDIVNDVQIAEVMRQLMTQNTKITSFTGTKAPTALGIGGRPRSTSTTSRPNGRTCGCGAPSIITSTESS